MKKKEVISKFERPAYKTPKTIVRPGSMDVLNAPSRIENTLFYPDGTTKNDKKSKTNS